MRSGRLLGMVTAGQCSAALPVGFGFSSWSHCMDGLLACSRNKNIKISSFKSSENIQKKEGGPDRSVSNK